ncbi:MAG: AmmeMemoRadiSam system radical SAM enzyme, partial [Bacteroidales bacterium]|nr:AmmeMemoRadiSam system radical SAM enzyme [Bacteroidales bacterium]
MKIAKFYNRLPGKITRCNLCPHQCNIKPENLGSCHVRKNMDGKLYSTNYGKVCSLGFDPIEKKPLYHFYPGSN